MEPLLELQRKTKAGEVAPLVDVAKNFWLWPGKAYWAYCRKEETAIRQLELRKTRHLASDARIANVVTLIGQIYDEVGCPERGELFFGLMAEDSWPMVAMLLDDDAVDIEFFEKVEQQCGRLTVEETEKSINTVGEVALLLEKIVSENRERVNPRKRSRWAEWRSCLFLTLYGAGVICLAGYWIIKLVRWIGAGS